MDREVICVEIDKVQLLILRQRENQLRRYCLMENNKLKEDIKFLAVGAAGANVAQMMEKKNYKTYYVNLAQ